MKHISIIAIIFLSLASCAFAGEKTKPNPQKALTRYERLEKEIPKLESEIAKSDVWKAYAQAKKNMEQATAYLQNNETWKKYIEMQKEYNVLKKALFD